MANDSLTHAFLDFLSQFPSLRYSTGAEARFSVASFSKEDTADCFVVSHECLSLMAARRGLSHLKKVYLKGWKVEPGSAKEPARGESECLASLVGLPRAGGEDPDLTSAFVDSGWWVEDGSMQGIVEGY